jgi:hypothetical protein
LPALRLDVCPCVMAVYAIAALPFSAPVCTLCQVNVADQNQQATHLYGLCHLSACVCVLRAFLL